LEAVLKKELDLPVTLVKGDRGIFEVRADGVVIYSKKECGDRFPTAAQIIALLSERG
jgi:predicted Rdx family selenoprotein